MFLVRFDEGLAVGDLVDGKGVGASLGDAEQSDYPFLSQNIARTGAAFLTSKTACAHRMYGSEQTGW